MKRVLTLLLALLMVLSLAACGSKEDDQPGKDTQAPAAPPPSPKRPANTC